MNNNVLTSRKSFLKSVTLLGAAALAAPLVKLVAKDKPVYPSDTDDERFAELLKKGDVIGGTYRIGCQHLIRSGQKVERCTFTFTKEAKPIKWASFYSSIWFDKHAINGSFSYNIFRWEFDDDYIILYPCTLINQSTTN